MHSYVYWLTAGCLHFAAIGSLEINTGLAPFSGEHSLCADYTTLLLWITYKYFLNEDYIYPLE